MEQFKGLPRLPTTAVPRRYELELRPDLDACKFDGKLTITLDVVEETKYLVLNSADLVIKDKSVWLRGKDTTKVLVPSNVGLDAEDEILVLEFEEALPRGKAILGIEFQGTLNDQMKGFYRSTYLINGEKRNMAVTQFEPADARRCFPCWDEPVCKATFKITVQAPVDRVVLSNMPSIEEKIDGASKTVSFEESPLMSTYLVAIVVGEFDYIEGTSAAGNKVRVYTEVGKTSQGKFALDVALLTLPFYAKYFGTPYSLPKLDMIAIPDFSAGAMENYGLVTYRETALLYDEKHSAAANKQRVAIVVAHELAHQWFGNLVTMEWWTHLWLNEGFATWVSYLAADHLFPEWKIWTQFTDQTMEAFRLDGLVESHPIEVEVHHASQIDEIFDAISYLKGASLIRMLESYLGAQCFQKGLVSYIKRYACKNARTEDLWAVLSEESGESVNELMDSWTKQKGYPVVIAKRTDDGLELEQSQYLSSGALGDGQWVVPITLCYGSYEVRKNALLHGKVGGVNLSDFKLVEASSQSSWIKLNVGQTAFYRVQYDDVIAARLRSAIAAGLLDATDRFGILDDTYALCSACKQPLSALLSLMDVYRQELDYTVLSCLINVGYKVSRVVSDAIPDSAAQVKLFIINLLQFAAEKLGWDPIAGESHLDAMLRGEILTALVALGHEETKQEGLKRFNIFLNDRSTQLLPADVRKAAYVAVMRNVTASDKSAYESLLNVYRETDLSQEKVRILGSLASSPDPSVVREALDFSMSPEVRNQDAVYVLFGTSSEGRETKWLWFKENWDLISKRWGSGFMITRFVSSSVSGFTTEEKADEIQAYFSTRKIPSIERTVSQSIERLRINAQWVKNVRQEKGLEDILQELAYRKY
ncbi:aminopeptidase M1 [Cryptomeria japonica]|uniref:aminopeptidase M1 n=1 Tax=Cryptomeria japonica TaxID=3369 RepID=UPI0025AC15AF|nr:aminopeptidase M1 [Cryptomeria japonica]XP_057851746.1 aminopeptidase M1 [Cryptomeria japonica]